MADFYVNLDGKVTQTKKKKKKQADFTVSLDGKVTQNRTTTPITTTKKDDKDLDKFVLDTIKKKDERSWFQSGAMKDLDEYNLYDFKGAGQFLGDLGKTILGSGADLLENIGAGIAGMGERAVDTAAYLAPAFEMSQKAQNGVMASDKDWNRYWEAQNQSQQFIQKDLYDEQKVAQAIIGAPLKSVGLDANNSVFGEKSDALIQSGGQLLATAGLQAVGVPWFLTTGATSFGGQTEAALNEGATYGQAGLSGAITAGADILTEMISGGIKFGGRTLDEGLTRALSQRIADKTGRTLLKLGMDATGEGFEEVLAGVVSNLGTALYKEESIGELLMSEEAVDEYIESFIGGAALGGGSSVISAVKSNKQGKDFVTGLSNNEQSVYDAEVKSRIEEAEKDGKKLTNKQKSEIHDEVREDLETGSISIGRIESILGGETYNQFKSIEDQEAPLLKELEEVKNNKTLTDEQKDVLTKSVQAKIDDLDTKTNKAQIREQLTKEVSDLTVNDNFLQESYREKERAKQKIQIDPTQYTDENARKTVENALNGGVNNTNRARKVVERLAKLSADKGIVFDLKTSKALAEAKIVVEGKTIDGYVEGNNITLNLNSRKAINTIVGHEITHVLESNPEQYDVLKSAMMEYVEAAEGKGAWNNRLAEVTERYKNVKGAVYENELVSDLVGEYLFTNKKFVDSLSTKDMGLFKTIWNEVKYLAKTFKGTKEGRQLAKAEKVFAEVYRKSGKATEKGDSKQKYHISEAFSSEIDKVLNDEMDKSSQVKARDFTPAYLVENGAKDLPMLITQNHIKSIIYTKEEAIERGLPTSKGINYHGLGKELLLKAIDNMDSPSAVYKQGDSDFLIVSEITDAEGNTVIIPVRINGKGNYNNVYIDENHITSVYGKKNLQDYLARKGFKEIDIKKGTALNEGVQYPNISSSFEDSVAEKEKSVKFSLSNAVDSNGNSLSVEQQEYFKDSKVRDENGNLKIMYHGTPNGEFSVFKDGTYFTDNKEYADRYQSPSASSISSGKVATAPKTFEVYLDIKKPFDINDPEAKAIYINDYIKGGNAIGINPYLSDAEYNKIDTIDWTEGEDLRDFLIENGYDYDGLILDEGADGGYGSEVEYRGKSYVVFSAEQIKNIDNTNPTDNPDINLSISDNKQTAPTGKWNVYGKDIMVEEEAPVAETVAEGATLTADVNAALTGGNAEYTTAVQAIVDKYTDPATDFSGWYEDFTSLYRESHGLAADAPLSADDNANILRAFESIEAKYNENYAAAQQANKDEFAPMTEAEANERDDLYSDRLASLTDEDMPAEVAPYDGDTEPLQADNPFWDRDIKEVGKRNVKAYMYENPEVKPFFQEEALNMLGELQNSTKGEKHWNSQLYYETNGELGIWGTKRATSEHIAYLLDNFSYTYKQIEDGLKAIIEDNGKENNAVSKRIEFLLDERLRDGYDIFTGEGFVEPNQDYLNLLAEKQITDYSDEAWNHWLEMQAEDFAPLEQEYEAPVAEAPVADQQYSVSSEQVEEAETAPEETLTGDDAQLKFNTETGAIEAEKTSALEAKKQKAFAELGDRSTYISKKARELYNELVNLKKGVRASAELGYLLDHGYPWKDIKKALLNVRARPNSTVNASDGMEAIVREAIGRDYDAKYEDIAYMEADEDLPTKTRKELQRALLEEHGAEIEKALDNAKNIPLAMLNNTDTIRATELVFGRETGRLINETIFQKEIDNEARSIRWQNKERADIKKLGIKAGSKESKAVQMYGEGEYVNEKNERIPYDDAALARDFPNVETQEKIKNAAAFIRGKYDNYIELANQSLTSLGFDPIPKRKDYFRHFQELNDAFTRFGLPFNAQALQEHVLPTDINGLTEFWSPQKNYFANAKPRMGIKTTYDAIKGIDGYISGISNLIYHTEDIQRGRAFEEMIRNRFGQEHGFDNFDNLPQEVQMERARKIQENHLSNYAAWVHEWTNNIAGKKNKIDRAAEAMFGRKAFAVLDETRKQVGANMIGLNVSSSLTNGIASVQAMAKTNPLAVVKGTADTIKNIFIKDDFMDKNNFLTSRMGTDMLARNPWEKMRDAGFIFMKGMDWFTSNQIVRSKFYELKAKGLTDEQAHAEAGQFASRIMADRTKGAAPQLYNSKLLGVVTQFQLEVNNQLYSMFYDTYHESKEHAKNNALKTAAGMTFTLGSLSALTHVYGKTFEALAGYNPTFDIIGIIATALGMGGDDDDEEKTTSERLKEAADKLVDALPYVNTLTGGGRIPIASGIPNVIGVLTGGKDEYGNELTWEDELKKLLYLAPPTGGNQFKKTTQGLAMFDDDLPVTGSYTDSGNLRFPVEDTPLNRVQAGLFGQWASENARDYFDNERNPLKSKQIEEYAALDLPIKEYWDYREGLSEQKNVEEKFDYIAGLDLPVEKKNIMINNVVDRKDAVDLTGYEDFANYEEFDFATKNPEKYDFLQANNVSYSEYIASDESKKAYNWAYENPDKVPFAKAAAGDIITYRQYASALNDIKGDKNSDGKTISGSRKNKVVEYLNGLDADYGARLLMFKSEYPSDDTYNYEIVEYLDSREDISYEETVSILKELGFTVGADGTVGW